MDPAGPVENSQNEFPTGPWTRRTRAHRLHRPFFVVVIKNEKQTENGRRDVDEVAPDQAKPSGSLRAIFDTWTAGDWSGTGWGDTSPLQGCSPRNPGSCL